LHNGDGNKWMETMKTHVILSAIASLVLFAGEPVSASTGTVDSSKDGTVVGSPGSVALVTPDTWYDCRMYKNRHARQRCDVIHGQPTPY
jgi:hypothetical protein